MLHEILERKDIIQKTTHHPRELIAEIFYAVGELLRLSEITVTSYTQHQAINIYYVIIHRTGKFVLEIRDWNRMRTIQKTWVGFKQFFHTEHCKLLETKDLTVQYVLMNHANVVSDVISGLKEVLQQEKYPIKSPTNASEPHKHAEYSTSVGGTTAEDADNDAGHSAAIFCCTTANIPRLWRQWKLCRKQKLLRPRRMWRPASRKLERWS